jgi:putative transposase
MSVWQRNYYERIIRNEYELNYIQKYIINNPFYWNEDENNPVNFEG